MVLISSNRILIETLSDLVRINSVNPAYAEGPGEAELQRYVTARFETAGLETIQQDVLDGRHNVIATLPGRDRSRRIVFEAHSDTAGVKDMTVDPFSAEVRGGRLFGRGACDTKAGLAAMIEALSDLKRSGKVPQCDVCVAAVIDEEHAYSGVVRLCEELHASAAIVAEPTEMRLVTASKGCLRCRIHVSGKAAHSSKPYLGVNAIEGMMRVLGALDADSRRLEKIRHPLVGAPTWNVGRIEGGTQVNVVPERCFVEIDRRLIPGEEPLGTYSDYKTLINKLREEFPNLEVNIEEPFVYDWPLDTAPDNEIVSALSQILSNRGLDGTPSGVAFGSDASKFAKAGIPSVILGPGSIDQAHTAEEYVDLNEVEAAFLVYRDLMLHYG